jgi:hypothetical protein
MRETPGYSGTPLAAKLGITAGTRALVTGAPPDWVLPDPPESATVHTRAGTGPYDVIVLFCPDHATLVRRFVPLTERVTTAGALWVAWPKRLRGRSGMRGIASDLTDNAVREYGLDHGLVDVKVAAVDATWSWLKFVRRLKDR